MRLASVCYPPRAGPTAAARRTRCKGLASCCGGAVAVDSGHPHGIACDCPQWSGEFPPEFNIGKAALSEAFQPPAFHIVPGILASVQHLNRYEQHPQHRIRGPSPNGDVDLPTPREDPEYFLAGQDLVGGGELMVEQAGGNPIEGGISMW